MQLTGAICSWTPSCAHAGNTMSFCNHVVTAKKGDTCKSIAASTGSFVINVDGMNPTSCETLKAGDPVCVSNKVKDVSFGWSPDISGLSDLSDLCD